jgi:chromosome partitioning protein
MRRIAVVNLKGGAGKTSTATALAVGLARRGKRVLLADTDPSGNASWTVLGGQGAEPPTIAAVLTRHASADEAVRPTGTPGLDLLPADAELGGVNVALAQELGRDTRLRSALAALEGRHDYLIVDTGPSLTTLLVNALVAVEEVFVPVDMGVYAVLGLVELERVVAEVRDAYNPALRLAGLVLTKAQRSNVCRDVEAELRGRYGPLVFGSVVPLSAKVEESHSRGLTVLDHAPRSAPALAYLALVEEVIRNGGREAKRRGVKAGGPAGAVDAA